MFSRFVACTRRALWALLFITTLCLLVFEVHAESWPYFVWQLHSGDLTRLKPILERAEAYGATEIQLSHDIISVIDKAADDPATAVLTEAVADWCHKHGMTLSVWAKELNIGKNRITQDLDPNGGGKEMWESRRAAYARAFERCPGIDRVVLQFGSTPTELWYVLPTVSEFNSRLWSERVLLTINQVKNVCDAYGKQLDVRDFHHGQTQADAIIEALKHVNGVRVMLKEVPQDWQLYYPLNPMIPLCSHLERIIEFDLGAEYWGTSVVPCPLVDYLYWRVKMLERLGIKGVVIRPERGRNSALDTPNEINIFALSRLVRDTSITPRAIYEAWFTTKYGIPASSPTCSTLIEAYRRLFEACRKMFYVRHHWALEKSSEIPEGLVTSCLHSKNLVQWNPDYKESFDNLVHPTEQTLAEILQEKYEAQETANYALKRITEVEQEYPSASLAQLKQQAQTLAYYAKVWTYITDAIFRSQVYRVSKNPVLAGQLVYDAQALEALAKSPPLAHPNLAPPEKIDAFVQVLRRSLPEDTAPIPLPDPTFFNVHAAYLGRGKASIRWESKPQQDTPVVWYGTRLPNLPDTGKTILSEGQGMFTCILEGLTPNTRYFVRIQCGTKTSGEFDIFTWEDSA
jgi:hypothetical protein